MSGNDDISNAYKEMLNSSPGAAPEPEAVAASRSLADDLIDAVGVPTEPKRVLTCMCGSTDFNVRSGLGSSTKINVCVKCGNKMYTKKKAYIPTVQTHAQGKGRGPIYSGPPKPRNPTDKYQPKYKLKSKPRKKDD